MKLKTTRESDLKEIEIEVDDLQYDLACKVQKLVKSDYPIVVQENGDLLIGVFIRTGNLNKGKDFQKYKIKIEKIKD